jgi:hypothetical protein
MYAVHLATGHNLWCQSLRLATINNYLLHAAQLVLYFDPEARDPRKDEHGHFAVCLQKVCHEIKRWGDIPEKWEPYTAPMHMLLAAKAANQPRDGLLNVLLDWFTVMLAAGGRNGEWAQPKHKAALSSSALNERGDPQAFCLGDIQFLGAGRRRLTHDYALSRPDDVALVNVRWRTQKNGDHGQIILFARNSTNQHLDLGAAWLRIIDGFFASSALEPTLPSVFIPIPLPHHLFLLLMRRFKMSCDSLLLTSTAWIPSRIPKPLVYGSPTLSESALALFFKPWVSSPMRFNSSFAGSLRLGGIIPTILLWSPSDTARLLRT